MTSVVRLPWAPALGWFLYLGGWIVLGGLARAWTAGPGSALGVMAFWLLLLWAFGRLQERAAAAGPAWLWRCLALAAGLAAACGIAAALDGGGLAALGLVLPAWAWLTASAWTLARRDAVPFRPMARSQAAAGVAGAALLWACAGDIADLRACGMRLLWGGLAASLLLALLPPLGAARAARRRHGPPGWFASMADIGCPRVAAEAPSWPLALASLAMLPAMCGLALWPELCGGAALPSRAMLGLHLLAMFGPALAVATWGADSRLAAAPTALAALVVATLLAAGWAPAAISEWVLALLAGAMWSLLWAASMADRSVSAVTLAAAAEAP